MRPARIHRAQLKLPIHLSVADRGQSFIGQTIDVSRTGFSVQVKTDERLPTILTAEIRPRSVTQEPIPCKARMVWQGGLLRGKKRASYTIISISPAHRRNLEELIQRSVRDLIADLGDLPVFKGTDVADLEFLLGLARVREAPTGTKLYDAGSQDGAAVYILLDGRVAIERPGKVARLGRGHLIGQWAEPRARLYAETAHVISDLRFLYLPTSLQPEVSRQTPRIASVLREALGIPPKRAAAILSQTTATRQKAGVLR